MAKLASAPRFQVRWVRSSDGRSIDKALVSVEKCDAASPVKMAAEMAAAPATAVAAIVGPTKRRSVSLTLGGGGGGSRMMGCVTSLKSAATARCASGLASSGSAVSFSLKADSFFPVGVSTSCAVKR